MEHVSGGSWTTLFGLTVATMGFAAFMTGRALAENWHPMWQVTAYVFLLGAVDRFLAFALFDAALLDPLGYLLDTALLQVIALGSFRMARASLLARQYPWLYERAGIFSCRERSSDPDTIA